jgi:hypothetical protein
VFLGHLNRFCDRDGDLFGPIGEKGEKSDEWLRKIVHVFGKAGDGSPWTVEHLAVEVGAGENECLWVYKDAAKYDGDVRVG